MADAELYEPSTALDLYHANRTRTAPSRLWARERLLHQLDDLGVLEFFEGPGDNPTVLTGYGSAKYWLRADAGLTTAAGEVRRWNGESPASDLANWPLSSTISPGTEISAAVTASEAAQELAEAAAAAAAAAVEDVDAAVAAAVAAALPTVITTSVTKTVHGASPDFATLTAAADWLENQSIGPGGSVTFSIAAGQHSYAAPIIFRHPNLDRVTIQGATLLGASVSQSTLPATGVDLSADRTTQLANLRAVYATEIKFSGAAGWLGFLGALPALSRLLITSDRTTLTGVAGLVVLNQGGIVTDCSVHGAGAHGWAVRSGLLLQNGAMSASGCTSSGLAVVLGAGHTMNGNLTLSTNTVSGLNMDGGFGRRASGYLYCGGNTSGIYASNGGSFEGYGGQTTITYATNGVDVNHGDVNLVGGGAVITQCGAYGVYNNHGRVTATSSVFGTITTHNGYANGGATNDLTGSSGGTGTYSPTANTDGNGNSRNIV